jgi:hypothetical protein
VDSASTHQTVKVETSRPIQNTVEAYALLRALEKEYGPAQEYQFARVSGLYDMLCLLFHLPIGL